MYPPRPYLIYILLYAMRTVMRDDDECNVRQRSKCASRWLLSSYNNIIMFGPEGGIWTTLRFPALFYYKH